MPIYEYRCDKCEREFEVERRITDPPLRSCPKCRSRKLRRLISQTSFVLKGGGWYSDLYSSKSKSDKGSESKDGAAAATDSKDSKDSKDSGSSSEKKESSPSKGGESPGGSGGKKGKKSAPKSAA